MDDLNQFLNSVEASARRILKQQHKKQQEAIQRDRVALVRASRGAPSNAASSPTASNAPSITREQLKASYSPGGALIVTVPPPPLSPHRRSENEDDDRTVLPRLPASPSHGNRDGSTNGTSSSVPLSLPAIEAKRLKAKREKRAADKIVNSPLYKSLAKSKFESTQGFQAPTNIKKTLQDVDQVNMLLKKIGMRDNSSPTRRPDHAAERRMCNACWADPTKLTGCEHHARILPQSGDAEMLRQMELQGPMSWRSDDLYVKFRSEMDRERLFAAFLRLKAAQDEQQQQYYASSDVPVIPIVVRHPIYAKFFTQIELENLKTQAATRRRNQTKIFIFDVNHLWLTNLDHFNTRLVKQERLVVRRQRRQEQDDGDSFAVSALPMAEEEEEGAEDEPLALRDRRDENAIRSGYSQIQSIATARALQHALFPDAETQMATSTFKSQAGTPPLPASSSPPKRRKRPNEAIQKPPLTLLVCGAWSPTDPILIKSLERVPGVALVGKALYLLWWLPSLREPDQETQTVALFARSTTLSSTNAILVSLVLALEATLRAPLWFAWHPGSKIPPPQNYEAPGPLLTPPRRMSPCFTTLLSTKLETRLDTLLPGTIMLLNTIAESEDHVIDLPEPYGHRRFWTEFTADAFRQWWLVKQYAIPAPYDVTPQPCSVLMAQPNATGVGGRATWHSIDVIQYQQHLNRRRVEKDYVYLVLNTLTRGSNDPLYVIVSLNHEVMQDVRLARLSKYLEMIEERRRKQEYEAKLLEIEHKIELGRLQLEAKRQEQQRLSQLLDAKAALANERLHGERSSMTDAMLMEWEARLQSSTVEEEQVGWQRRMITQDESDVVFYYALNESLPRRLCFAWERPSDWVEQEEQEELSARTETSDLEEDDTVMLQEKQQQAQDAVTQLAQALLADEQFLAVLKVKLGLDIELTESEQEKKAHRRRSTLNNGAGEDDSSENDRMDLQDHLLRVTQHEDPLRGSLMALKMAKLELPAAVIPTKLLRGEGWKRLKVSRLPKNFARGVYSRHTEGPRSAFINQTNTATPVGMLDPREASPYEPPEFIPELRTQLIPKPNADLQERKLQHAEFVANHATAVSATPERVISRAQAAKDALFEKDPVELEHDLEQLVGRAVLAARNNNLQALEDALDGGVDINSRDNHGNSLFILVCQQGNKKIAKFLMRRHADMNLQNLSGNTALHYLHAYKHKDLAEYITSKGAIDTIANAAGLTCYEGLSVDQAEAI
ncbi:hypothetical protein Poli38472_012100 [Pythium oligandrum]|uniref:Uncharacterized protein n=1 Tax=Pythium oligandrum TaxID=41045 RepID=A0A8K1CP19_PYTOL|nr:hypothetical protein Poli38472_012100 [Pythium oligandrum]|eukprot:TMW66984.1 hypothetical protein Poli38472_012100 [Pythium oligandrum]